jgi:hypothetical protein
MRRLEEECRWMMGCLVPAVQTAVQAEQTDGLPLLKRMYLQINWQEFIISASRRWYLLSPAA